MGPPGFEPGAAGFTSAKEPQTCISIIPGNGLNCFLPGQFSSNLEPAFSAPSKCCARPGYTMAP